MTGYSIELKIVSNQIPKALKAFVAFTIIVILGFPVVTFLAERGIFKSQGNAIMFSIAFIFFITIILALIFTVTNSEYQFLKTYKEVGKLKIGMDALEIEDKVIPLSDLDNLKIKYHSFCGERSGKYISDGTNNYLEYSLHGKKFSQQVLFENERTLDKLRILFEHWYGKGYRFKEYTKDIKSYMLNNDLTYAQIQEIKKKVNLESWY